MFLSPGQEIAERYEIIEKIGSGGMANVYKAMDKKLRRYVTFKVMREEYISDDDFIKRFDVEARAAASLLNQHIVNVYDVGQEGHINYIVMEYVDGVTLKALIKRRAPFENDEILGVAIQIATALEHAHKNKIIHRDIKPQNILVTRGGISKVTDFGIARASTAATMTTTSNAMGSVHYFSPEQARGGFVDIKSDIYSLGIVMYEMATGQLPFDGDTAISVALKHINEPLPDPREINANLSDKIVSIIKKATSKLSAERYENITEMCSDLKRALTNSADDINRFTDSTTISLTDEEIETINRESAMNQPETKVPRLRRTVPKEPEEDDFDDYGDDGLFSDKKVVIAAIATSIVLILLISAILYSLFWKPRAEDPKQPINVPNFAGWSLEDAETVTKSLGVEIKVEGEESSDSVPDGNIISQNYGDSDEIYAGGTMWVTISRGSDKYRVPDVVMKEISEAYVIFEGYNYPLQTNEVMEWNDDVPQNVVIRQEPEGGTMVSANTLVTLYISNGPKQKTVIVPSLTDMTEAQAINALQSIGLAAPPAVRSSSASVPEGKVVRQMISAGTEVPTGTAVEFVVSTGAPQETPSPSPSPSPSGDTQPSGDATPKPEKVTKTFPIDLANIPEGAESVHLLVIMSTASGNTTVFNERVNVSDLPVQVSVSGAGHAELIVFTVDEDGNSRSQGSQSVDFTEEIIQ